MFKFVFSGKSFSNENKNLCFWGKFSKRTKDLVLFITTNMNNVIHGFVHFLFLKMKTACHTLKQVF